MTTAVARSRDASDAVAPATPSEQRDLWIIGACSVVAMALTAWATTKGPGFSPDSVRYLAAGVNLLDKHHVWALDDTPLTSFAPGMPVVAALGDKLGLSGETTLRLVSILSFGAIVAMGGLLLQRMTSRRSVVIGATALLAVSPALFDVSKMAWSEPPFIAVTLAFLLVLGRLCARRTLTGVDMVAITALCWSAFLLRYVGSALIVTTGIVLLVSIRPLDRRTVVRLLLLGAALVAVPLAWMARNHAADGTLLGPRTPSPDNVGDVAERTLSVIGDWLVSTGGFAMRNLAVIGAGVVAVATWGLVVSLRARSRSRAGSPAHPSAPDARRRAYLLCCSAFILVYVLNLSYASLTTDVTPTDSRYLSPIYVPLVAVLAVGVAVLFDRRPAVGWRWAVVGVVALVFVSQLLTTVSDAKTDARDGIALNTPSVRASAVGAATASILSTQPQAVVYSNNPNQLWVATKVQPVHFAPRDLGIRGTKVNGAARRVHPGGRVLTRSHVPRLLPGDR